MSADRVEPLYTSHAEEIRVYLTRRLGDHLLAADLVQDLFLRVAEKPGIGDLDNVRAYLYRMASNLATDHQRRLSRHTGALSSVDDVPDIVDDRPGQESILEGKDRLARVGKAIASLPDLSQEIFRRNRLEGHSYAEVARQLSISESSVQKHLARALAHALAAVEDEIDDGVTGPTRTNVLSLREALKARRR